ncbi:hypothetical protein E2C01_045496 [Portunus trituberculatus]|uniref:Uncharacterized protein n=1 Tax=Portunus trituberculatus TaxID=210409 RepID=A0A5B7G2F5_PORTR|nr:hypothetical protein [Portunus trituberculatus]
MISVRRRACCERQDGPRPVVAAPVVEVSRGGGGAGNLRSQESAGAGCVGCVSPAMCDVRGGSGGPPHYPACGCLFNHVGSPSKAKVMTQLKCQGLHFFLLHVHNNTPTLSRTTSQVSKIIEEDKVNISLPARRWTHASPGIPVLLYLLMRCVCKALISFGEKSRTTGRPRVSRRLSVPS